MPVTKHNHSFPSRSSTSAIYTSLSPSKNVIKVSLVKSITTQQFQSTDDRRSMAISLLLSARLPLLKGNLHSRYDVEGRFVPSSPHDPSLTAKTAWKSPPFPRKEFEFIKNFCFIMFYGHQSFENEQFTYLGRHFNFQMDDEEHKSTLVRKCREILTDIDKLPLHPKHKIELYGKYLLSKISWDLTVADLGMTWVKQNLDNISCSYLRKWLEIPINGTLDIIFFSFHFIFILISINPKYNLTKDTLQLRTYMITTIKTKNYRLTILKIMIKVTYMIVFKIDRLRRSSLSR